MPIQDITTLKGYFNNGDVPTESEYIDLIDSMFSMQTTISEGPGIDLTSNLAIGLGLDSILVGHQDGSPATEYATITLACAGASSGDIILIARAGTFSESFTVPAGVSLVGLDREKCIITGLVTLGGPGSVVDNVSIIRTANSANVLSGIVNQSSGTARVYSTTITIIQSGTGNAYGVQTPNAGTLELWECDINASSIGGSGYGIAKESNADVVMIGGRLVGSTKQIYLGVGVTGTASIQYYNGYKSTDIGNYSFTMSSSNNDWGWCNWFINFAGSFTDGHTYITVKCISTSGNPVQAQMMSGDTGVNPSLSFNTSNGSPMVAGEIRELDGNGYWTYQDGYFRITNGWGGPWSITMQIVNVGWKDSNWVKHDVWTYGTTYSKPKLYGVDGGNTTDAESNDGDRSAWDAENYPLLHTNDNNTATGIHHTLGTGATNAASGNHAHTPSAEAANKVYAGPASGANAIPTFRSLTANDIPAPSAQAANKVYAGPASGADAAPTFRALTIDDVPEQTFDPVAANMIFAGPTSGTDATPTFRALTVDDIPEGIGTGTGNTHYELLQDSSGAILTDDNGEILYVEVDN